MGVHVTDVRHDGVTVTPKAAARPRSLRPGPSSGPRASRPCHSRGVSQRCSRPSPTMPDASRWQPTCPCPGIRRSSSSVTSSAATTCRAWLRTPCRRNPRCRLRSSRSRRQGSSALPLPRCRLCGLHQPWTRPAASRPGQARRVHRLAGLGLIHIAFLTGLENRISTLATWLATIARARRTDRTFILGSTTSPEHPYTWLKFVHPNMLHATHHSGEATPTP